MNRSNVNTQEQFEDFIQSIDHPNLFSPIQAGSTFLKPITAHKIESVNKTIPIMEDIINAIIHIKIYLFLPVQIPLECIFMKENKWGLISAICYRQKKSVNKGLLIHNIKYKYDDTEYDDHFNQETQLVWQIGKIWYYLLFNKKLKHIAQIKQNELYQQIQNHYDLKKSQNTILVETLKKIYKKDSNHRLSFLELIQSQCLFINNQIEDRIYKIKIIQYIDQVHKQNNKIKKMNPSLFRKSSLLQQSSMNPFLDHIFLRQFSQILQINKLFIICRNIIKQEFLSQKTSRQYPVLAQQRQQIIFSCYIVLLQNYFTLKQFEKTRKNQNYQISNFGINQKLIYSKFIQRLLKLQQQINLYRKKYKQSNSIMVQKYPKLFTPINAIFEPQVSQHYKQYFREYISILNSKLDKYQKDSPKQLLHLQKILQMLLGRTIKYIFKTCRQYLFIKFSNSPITLGQILTNLKQCQNVIILKQLYDKVTQLYFPHANIKSMLNK